MTDSTHVVVWKGSANVLEPAILEAKRRLGDFFSLQKTRERQMVFSYYLASPSRARSGNSLSVDPSKFDPVKDSHHQ